MNRHSDQDFERLNALADGELSSMEAATLEQRLRDEPDLKATFDEIRQVKRKLNAMTFGGSEESQVQPRTRMGFVSRPWAIAASIAGLGLVAAFLVTRLASPDAAPVGVLAWHDHLSAKEYVVNDDAGPVFVSLGKAGGIPVPDLSPSKLYLVDTEVIDADPGSQRAVMHYRGLRGCRLTLWYGTAGAGPADVPPAGSGETFHSWTIGQGSFALIATGMDKQRFASIADYVEVLTKLSENDGSTTRTAMADAYDKAVRCA